MSPALAEGLGQKEVAVSSLSSRFSSKSGLAEGGLENTHYKLYASFFLSILVCSWVKQAGDRVQSQVREPYVIASFAYSSKLPLKGAIKVNYCR